VRLTIANLAAAYTSAAITDVGKEAAFGLATAVSAWFSTIKEMLHNLSVRRYWTI